MQTQPGFNSLSQTKSLKGRTPTSNCAFEDFSNFTLHLFSLLVGGKLLCSAVKEKRSHLNPKGTRAEMSRPFRAWKLPLASCQFHAVYGKKAWATSCLDARGYFWGYISRLRVFGRPRPRSGGWVWCKWRAVKFVLSQAADDLMQLEEKSNHLEECGVEFAQS